MRASNVHRALARSAALALGAVALALGAAQSALAAGDVDADGVADAADDCRDLANPLQRDTDRDGYGNRCDADFDGDGRVGWSDLGAVQRAFGARLGQPAYSPNLDLDGDGAIGLFDVNETRRLFGTAPGPSGLACAGQVPCFAGQVVLQGAEEVLSRSVRLRWRPSSPMSRAIVERRTPGGSWGTVGLRWTQPGESFVDGGADGRGLAPGTYEYRVRGDGPWSDPRSVEIPAECEGQPPTDPSLPVVEIADLDRDGDYDGDDVRAALATCSALRGCVLRARPVVYENVNVELAGGTGYAFPNGLVIEGYGSATVFRSRVFSLADHQPALCPPGTPAPCYEPRPVFWISQPGRTVLDGVRFRNFQIEGRKREQPDPGIPENAWFHWGIDLLVSTGESTDGGCIHGVGARELMTGGFGIQHAVGWILERNRIEDVGCQDDLTPCDALVRTPEYLTIPGVRSTGFGIVAGLATDSIVARDNRVSRSTKYGISSNGADSVRAWIHDNTIEAVGAAGIQCNGCTGARIERNLVHASHYPTGRNATWPDGYRGDVAHGINCTGGARDVAVLANVVSDSDGTGLRLLCGGPNVVAQGNVLVGNCRVYGQSLVIGDGDGARVASNEIEDSQSGCTWSVLVNGARNARLEGGSIRSGPATRVGIFVTGKPDGPTTGLTLRDLRLEAQGSSGAAVELVSPSQATTVYDSVCNLGFPNRLIDISSGGTALARDPSVTCP